MERGEQDRQRDSRRESNSGCAVCRRTSHQAIGTNTASNFYVLLAIAAQVLVTL